MITSQPACKLLGSQKKKPIVHIGLLSIIGFTAPPRRLFPIPRISVAQPISLGNPKNETHPHPYKYISKLCLRREKQEE